MNEPVVDPIQRRKQQIIATVFGFNLVFGVVVFLSFPGLVDPATSEAALEALRQSGYTLVYQVVGLLLCFLWLGLDSHQLDIRRPWWLNVGIVLFALVFVPYYLYKTRPEARRLPAILAFFGIAIGGAFAMTMGAAIATVMTGGAASSASL